MNNQEIKMDSKGSSPTDHQAVENFAWDFVSYIANSPSSFHAAQQGAAMLKEAGFEQVEETQAWDASPGGHYLIRGGALMAWFVPEGASKKSGFRIIGAHTDSPGFKLKLSPDFQSAGWQQAAVEVYGGPILASWLDRELVLAGKLGLIDGTTRLVSTPPVLRIPSLAIHLDREANKALTLDRQRHMQPVFSCGHPDLSILEVLAKAADVKAEDIISHDLITADAQPGEIFGATNDFLSSGRLDNLSSLYPGLRALIEASQDVVVNKKGSPDILLLAAFDHEEVGSATVTGAAGPILEDVIYRTATALGADNEDIRRMIAASTCVSADAAHSIHPNYPERHDSTNFPVLGSGPALKINANQRYASNTETEALWIQACLRAGFSSQVFVGNNAVPCGSTIGPITATRLGIPTVDVGIPLLSMHSARELASISDIHMLMQALHSYLVG
ncbi:M18 family aminopeptidase [Corynebacterium pseudotuberculosis]|uniref:M18 family aminopeptidase n=2 Tax=Corynebacterium pseudotuberculosis TaxID=1719 RepID=A0AAU8PQR3_CORPS|nr:M18 family aminopeptidase [Corynebacterium pseudotuberculosis CIP 52.97]AER69090.1 Aminopeptidase 2 [Corynebacterium pseudotuberculosis 1/06-A]AFB72389.2 M18 family aminopeptidase [Corynebacterium pseudotuberculosis 316]AFK16686.1 M18 family aminopeptidase [Corynebacterium pseudotuberculosis 258]AMN70901.2 M18 family aminopeptidase [Corynebacterium pseudotuberculosis]